MSRDWSLCQRALFTGTTLVAGMGREAIMRRLCKPESMIPAGAVGWLQVHGGQKFYPSGYVVIISLTVPILTGDTALHPRAGCLDIRRGGDNLICITGTGN